MSLVDQLKESTIATRVTFHWFGASRKMEEHLKNRMADAIEADEGSLTISKRLYNVKIESIKKINALKSQIKQYWEQMTLPYAEHGIRLLKKEDLEAFNLKMGELKFELQTAALVVHLHRQEILEDAQERLKQAFNPSNYPEDFASLFGMEWSFPSLEPPDYLAQLSPKVYQIEQEKAEQRFRETIELAEQMFLQELKDLVSHLQEKLTPGPDGKAKVFHASAIANLHEFFDRFQKMSIGSSKELDSFVQEAKSMVAGIDAKDLRSSKELRAQIAQEMGSLSEKLTPLIVNKPRRAITKPSAQARQEQPCLSSSTPIGESAVA